MEEKKKRKGIIMIGVLLTVFIVMSTNGCSAQEESLLKNADITIGVWWNDLDAFTDQPMSDIEERRFEYLRRIQREYEFSIRQKHVANWENMMQRAVLSIMAGSPDASVFVVQAGWAKMMQWRGILYPISDSTAVDMSPKQPNDGRVDWSQAILNAFRGPDGRSYAFGVGEGKMNYPMFIYFNKRLFREAGLDPDLPYDMQRDGTWTWENFLEICKQLTRDTNNDGIIDVYAMCIDLSTEIHNAFISSNGANYVDVDPATGRFVNASTRPEFIEALQFLRRLRDEGVMKRMPEGANWDWYQNEFIEGRVAMRIEPRWITDSLANMRDDWGMVLPPMGPRVDDYVIYTDELAFVIPNTFSAGEVDQILRGVELWYAPVDDSPDAWKDAFYHAYRDSRAIDETLAIVHNPRIVQYKYHLWVPGFEHGEIVWNNLETDLSPAQLVESVTQSWNSIIDEANDIALW